MQDTSLIFQRRRVDIPALLAYGFQPQPEGYGFTTVLLDGQFRLRVSVTPGGNVDTAITDIASGDDYVLYKVPRASGAFVGAVREACRQVLEDIAHHCFPLVVFNTAQAGQVRDYIRDRYRNELEFLWPRTPDNAIFRRSDNAKWYGAILTVKPASLGLPGEQRLEILNIRMEPQEIIRLTDRVTYFPGYHMNKKHWVTLLLDGALPAAEIFRRIDDSYLRAAKK
ncbi:hypothetical protein F9C28_14700 [Shimwellia pseudoproteus]|uniref:MmcQ/YjbR family DNA-binding protein n=1 Tax=Shimwellia pseudoproteus TaxID=570012 RepID=UPI0018EBE616|nr:MmcQ/YjbR family DNA-binding protein [Shimwellia pseudoproteus]MBJ3816144.1 hypothetical protein [Shimwellia pseudoproteus]